MRLWWFSILWKHMVQELNKILNNIAYASNIVSKQLHMSSHKEICDMCQWHSNMGWTFKYLKMVSEPSRICWISFSNMRVTQVLAKMFKWSTFKQWDGRLSEKMSKGVLLSGCNLLKRQRWPSSEMDDVLCVWTKSLKQDKLA